MEYVAIPPASLSTDAVMIPGPRTDRNSAIFALSGRRNRTISPQAGFPPLKNSTPPARGAPGRGDSAFPGGCFPSSTLPFPAIIGTEAHSGPTAQGGCDEGVAGRGGSGGGVAWVHRGCGDDRRGPRAADRPVGGVRNERNRAREARRQHEVVRARGRHDG